MQLLGLNNECQLYLHNIFATVEPVRTTDSAVKMLDLNKVRNMVSEDQMQPNARKLLSTVETFQKVNTDSVNAQLLNTLHVHVHG